MKRTLRMLRVLSAVMVALLLIAAPASGRHHHDDDDDDEEIPFDEANVFFELNHTDGDLGIHALVDGEPWKELEIETPDGRESLKIRLSGKLRRGQSSGHRRL